MIKMSQISTWKGLDMDKTLFEPKCVIGLSQYATRCNKPQEFLKLMHKENVPEWLFGKNTLTCLLSKYTRLTFWDIFVTLLTLFAAYSLNFLMPFFQPTHLLFVLLTLSLVKYLPNDQIENLLSNFLIF